MALLVTDQGEIDSLRTLLNATHEIPRNLVLKLYTSNTTPKEQDTPNQNDANTGGYWEPYDATNNLGYGSTPTTGYPECIDVRTEENQNYGGQYGILLNGNRWSINTTPSAVVTHNGAGTTGTYQITVDAVTDIKKGDYVTHSGGAIPTNTYVVDIQGTDLELSQKLTATFTSAADNVSFGKGRTTASYPEQVFTFSDAANNVYGYYLARANNMPYTLHGVADGGSVAAGTTITKAEVKGVIGNKYIELKDGTISSAISAGAQNGFVITVASGTGVEKGQVVTGTNIPAETRVTGVATNDIYLDKPITGGAASGNAVFTKNVASDLTIGQRISKNTTSGGNTGPDAFPANTVIEGIDYATKTNEQGPRVYLSNALTDNVGTASSNDEVDVKFSVVTTDPSGSAVAHGLHPGDVIYIAQGSTSSIDAAHYTVFKTPTTSTFTTTPAIPENKVGDATLYSSIFFAERFTNGPYAIQNSGDQIKVTLNVSLD